MLEVLEINGVACNLAGPSRDLDVLGQCNISRVPDEQGMACKTIKADFYMTPQVSRFSGEVQRQLCPGITRTP